MNTAAFEVNIGLEIHIKLSTHSKIFCGCSADYGAAANTQVCPVCLGLPGSLPVLNRRAVELALRCGFALGTRISKRSLFARKNYFYPDLPKGFQITQFEQPLCLGGGLDIDVDDESRYIPLRRIHLEEDAGKSFHRPEQGDSAVDYNRAGVPLIEVVTEPAMRSPDEAVAFLQELHAIVTTLGVSNGRMDEGSFRCDANVSLRPASTEELGVPVEIKNVNSFRFVGLALKAEIDRQRSVLFAGLLVAKETRSFDERTRTTHPMREKENSDDYRYFLEPDLLPLDLPSELVDTVAQSLPELPRDRRLRLEHGSGLSKNDAHRLVALPALADLFDAACQKGAPPLVCANLLLNHVAASVKEQPGDSVTAGISSQALAAIACAVETETISGPALKTLIRALLGSTPVDVESFLEAERSHAETSFDDIEKALDSLLSSHPAEAEKARQGEKKVLSFFIGQLLKTSPHSIDPKRAAALVKKRFETK